ncbi:GAF domain-containing protein [Actinoplanes oblitus]|uniref:GAF domain-containing protein n=1 Tax=Actinoplanes oblitus TaxID=3040509 RepID=A0ABY8WAD1_9ACTN|nr:GAF domain-containing protein [Actinoplanes oblitus]WIM94096.1 GAF domain-containing protein [Actinoplanes oblitus]
MRKLVTDDEHQRHAVPGHHQQAGDVTFSQVARLELDDLLDQLLVRVRDVQGAQGRLRGLLRAFLAVARADSLDTVLQHVVEAARELVDARYAALGVISRGHLARFVHTGMDAETVAAVGHLPDGKGLLGLLVEHPQTLRLANIAEHRASTGFPDHHPPMRSFLGVPIQIGGRIFGNLYLTDKQDAAQFTDDDEQLVQALATAAGAAIENATLLSESRRRHTWQTTMVEVSTQLLAGTDTDEVLKQLVHHARQTLGGVAASVSVPTDDPGRLRVAVTEGDLDQPLSGALVPKAGSAGGAAIIAGKMIIIDDPLTDLRATADCPIGPIGETIAVPLIGADTSVNGALTVSRAPDTEPFDQLDKDLITAVAAHAGLALHLSRVRADAERLHLLDDRERIGDDLRHTVIQRLFRHGLELQSAVSRSKEQTTRATVQIQIDEIDAIIHDIRATVFALGNAEPTADDPPAGQDAGTAP